MGRPGEPAGTLFLSGPGRASRNWEWPISPPGHRRTWWGTGAYRATSTSAGTPVMGAFRSLSGAASWLPDGHRPGRMISSSARLLVMTKLETRCRLTISSYRSADCWPVRRCSPRLSGISRSAERKDLPEGALHRFAPRPGPYPPSSSGR